jgi:hypothetical protein
MTGLSPTHLERIREGLAGGRRPRVVFTDSAGQMAGQVGQVVGLTDPAVSEEWVVVRFGRDELPFSPADLRPPTRAAKQAPPAGNGHPTVSNTGNGKAGKSHASNGRAHAGNRRPSDGTAIRSTRDSAAPAEPPEPAAATPPPAVRPARPKAPKQPAALAVTVAYADGAWTVAATHGSRTISRAQPIRAAEALRLVAMLDAPSVHDAVAHIIAAERSAAEQRAQRLRTELAEIETRLAELRDTR